MKNYKKIKAACYFTSLSMSAFANISPLLFVAFNELYDISFTLLGFLVLVNFCSQLLIDLVFTFFGDKFNLKKTLIFMPLLMIFGTLIYALVPKLFPSLTYIALVSGTLIFSFSMGLGEVLASPVIAAIPAENSDREVSKLHAVYAWGTVMVVVLSTVFIKLVGGENWFYLPLLWCVLPFCAFFLFLFGELPDMSEKKDDNKNVKSRIISKNTVLFAMCIFFGGAAECTMTQWVSGFAETALKVDKVFGDIFGMAFFALFLAIGRTLYTQRGKNIERVLTLGMLGAVCCYVFASVSPLPVFSLVACALTGFCTSMLWPGTLIYTGEKLPFCPVGVYALLAAGGDLGASISPQIVGIVTDTVSASGFASELSQSLSVSPEQLAMRCAMLVAAIFPLCGFVLLLYMKKHTGDGA